MLPWLQQDLFLWFLCLSSSSSSSLLSGGCGWGSVVVPPMDGVALASYPSHHTCSSPTHYPVIQQATWNLFARLLLMLWCSPSHVGFNWMKNRICKLTNLRSKDLPGRPSWPPVISLTVLVETLPPPAGNPPVKFKELTQAWMNNSDSIVTWKKHWPFPFTCLEVFNPHCLGFVLQYVPVQALTLC